MKNNYIAVDFDPNKAKNIEEWNKFVEGLNETSGVKWQLYGTDLQDSSFHSKERYFHYFKIAWKLFVNRNTINALIANQQFYGIIFAFFSRLFHVEKKTKNVIVSFIYNKKNGIVGKIYERFIKYSINNQYVEKLIVHSNSEVDYYANLLHIEENKLMFCPLGITDDSKQFNRCENADLKNSYVLGVGNSNRDFLFMENALVDQDYLVRIFSDKMEPHNNKNIVVNKGVSVEEYYTQLASCFCSVVPIDNPNFSSGQLIMLQSYAFEKPVIITKSNVNDTYIGDGNAIVINKNREELLSAIESLRDNTFYNRQVKKAKCFFDNNFSMYAMGKKLGLLFRK